MSTYLQNYQEYLQSLLNKGGDPAAINAVVREYNEIGHPAWDGSASFTAWIQTAEHQCTECATFFKYENNEDVASCRKPPLCSSCFLHSKELACTLSTTA